jgi:hypothetical protein
MLWAKWLEYGGHLHPSLIPQMTSVVYQKVGFGLWYVGQVQREIPERVR